MSQQEQTFQTIIEVIRKKYSQTEYIPMYQSLVLGNTTLNSVLENGQLSTASSYVSNLESKLAEFTGANYVVALNSGTTALHMALKVVGVNSGDLVLTQALSFVATGNSILYNGAVPHFLDVEAKTLGMNPDVLEKFLKEEVELIDNRAIHKAMGKKISACVPVHVLGFPANIERIVELCRAYNIPVVEDAAESFGSALKGRLMGTFGDIGCLSFNGNKVVTAGSGGAILTNNKACAERISHLSSTAKISHEYEFIHNELGYNNGMAGINAALLLDQLENLEKVLEAKRDLAKYYHEALDGFDLEVLKEESGVEANYWLNTIRFKNVSERTAFLKFASANKVQCRPIWKLLSDLPHFKDATSSPLPVAEKMYATLVSLPSYVTKEMLKL